jgi:hypothetical protein
VRLRTDCINKFISYPFIVIALLLLSRSALFGNYGPDAPILIVTGISLMVAFIIAWLLPPAAEKAREYARGDIARAIIRTKGLSTLGGIPLLEYLGSGCVERQLG